ncbi:MAG: TonB family protein [Candidatus Omnitrophota bacterium]
MLSEKTFQIAFLLSLIAHGVILFKNPGLNLNVFSRNKQEQNLEVSYLKPPDAIKEILKITRQKEEPLLKLPQKVILLKTAPPPFIDKDVIFKKEARSVSGKHAFTKPAFIKPDIIAIKKKITLPPIGIDKVDNPSYISYYQIVREKIRRAAYQNYSRTEVGEVYLSFVISQDGSLKEMRLAQEKSSSSPYLKEIALQSVKEASPFPNFPKELDYPQLSFNVVISFEVE